jgi:hypothetical protein
MRALFILSVSLSAAVVFPYHLQGQAYEYAACIPQSNCAGGCFPGSFDDASCPTSPHSRCVLYSCTAGDTKFQYCQQSTNQNPGCSLGTSINVNCSGCTQWLGSCTNLDPSCKDLPWCGSAGGNSPFPLHIVISCT